MLEEKSDALFEDLVIERAQKMFDLVQRYAVQPRNDFNEYFIQTDDGAEVPEKRIEIFAEYKGNFLTAILFPTTKQILFNGQRGTVTQMTEIAVTSFGTAKRAQNGWSFWKYIDEQQLEHEIDDLREQVE